MLTASIDRLARDRSRHIILDVGALLVLGGVVASLELHATDLDHGTHLLVILILVIGAALLLGPGPAAIGLAAGAGISGLASAITVEGALAMPHAYVQHVAYLLAGSAFIGLVSIVVRSRRLPAGRVAPPLRPAPGGRGPVEPLTARECEVLRLAATGIAVDEIARRLYVSPNTAKTHLTHVYAKLGVRGRSDAIRAALHCGCLTTADICPHRIADGTSESPVPVTTTKPRPPTI